MGAFENENTHITGWKQLFSTGKWDHKLELSQEVLHTLFAGTWERRLIC